MNKQAAHPRGPWIDVEILRGKGTGNLVLSVGGTRVAGLKDGYGYTLVSEFRVRARELEAAIREAPGAEPRDNAPTTGG